MLRFYLILIFYLLFEISSFIFINNFSLLIFIVVFSSILFLALIVWGVSSIKSQMFLPSFNYNHNATGKIAISFDDGPHKENTVKLLKILEEYNAKANFFLIGKNIRKHPEIAEQIYNSGHLIGNHSFNHTNNFPFLSRKKMEEEIMMTQREIEKITHEKNKYFRPPFGVTNPVISHTVKNLNLQTIGWSIRSFDTKKNIPKEKILKSVISKIKSGDIILLHDKTKNICWLTEEILKYLQKDNLTAVTIDKLMI